MSQERRQAEPRVVIVHDRDSDADRYIGQPFAVYVDGTLVAFGSGGYTEDSHEVVADVCAALGVEAVIVFLRLVPGRMPERWPQRLEDVDTYSEPS